MARHATPITFAMQVVDQFFNQQPNNNDKTEVSLLQIFVQDATQTQTSR